MATNRGKESVHIYFHNSDKSAEYLATTKLNTANLPVGYMAVPERVKVVPNSTKLHWDKLNSTKSGVRIPMENKGWITRRFNELNRNGWKVVNYNKKA